MANLYEKDIRKLGKVLGINRRLMAKKDRVTPFRGRESGVDAETAGRIL